MINFLNDIRNAENPISNNRKLINTIAILFLGIALGTFSKYLDFRQTELPGVLMAINGILDIGNFLGRFAIWILIALCISIYSNSAIRASINVFVFFVGMVASYYLYSNYIAGFFPRSYAMIWFGFTAVSPLLAFFFFFFFCFFCFFFFLGGVLVFFFFFFLKKNPFVEQRRCCNRWMNIPMTI